MCFSLQAKRGAADATNFWVIIYLRDIQKDFSPGCTVRLALV